MTVSANEKAQRSLSPSLESPEQLDTQVTIPGRRSFLKRFGTAGLGTTAALLFGDTPLANAQSTSGNLDTAAQILTAAVVAEDLATTFYYNGLVGQVIQDPSLAGPGGSATSGTGNVPNVTYLRAAMAQEIAHANLLRTVGNLGSSAATDPYQTFYFPAGTFSNLAMFTSTLATLESAFIAAYLTAIREFSNLALRAIVRNVPTGPYGGPFSAGQLSYFAEVAASIMGVECEHRVLVGVINNENQPNNLDFEQTLGLTAVYNGSSSAVSVLTPFLTPSNGQGYTLAAALGGAATVGVPSTGNPPPQ